jgi:alpha-mannosidase
MMEILEQARRELKVRHDWDQHWAERIRAELEFAEALCALHPGKAKAWRALVGKAAATVARAAADDRGLAEAVAEAEAILAPLGKAAKGYAVYAIGHAHIDMNWMWSWPETVALTCDTFATVLRLMEEFPEFRFSQSQASVYAIVEEHRPDLLAQIAERVREGRWEVAASHWVEADKNMAGGEALCRHLLYTRRYMQALFGLGPEDVTIDWSPDTFGHAATVPSYLTRGGVRHLYLHRPGVHTPEKPRAFRWRGPDGATVLVHNDMAVGYNGMISHEIIRPLLDFARETGLPFAPLVYGIGDHGGGPTRRDLLRAADMQDWPVFPAIVFATAREYFGRLEREGTALPVIDGELNVEFAGCFTSQALIKKANRFGEARLADAETVAALAWATLGQPYPASRLEAGWRDILFSHFHDILPGSGVHDTRTFCHGAFQRVMAMTGTEEAKALRALAAAVDTSGVRQGTTGRTPPVSRLATALGSGVGFRTVDGGPSQAEQSAGEGDRPMLVFNPVAEERQEVVECTVWDNAQGWQRHGALAKASFSVRTPDGAVLPAQILETGAFWGHDFVRLAFPLAVPALGHVLCAIAEEEAPPAAQPAPARQTVQRHHCPYSHLDRACEGLENEFLRVEIDPATGAIRALIDKRADRTLIETTAAPALEFGLERPHAMNAWTIEPTGPAETPVLVRLVRQADGPWRAALAATLRFRESEFTITYELLAGIPRLNLHVVGTWFQRGTPETGIPALSLALPFRLRDAHARYEIPFGAIARPALEHGEEVPALNWAEVAGRDANGKPAGCLLLNDSKHGHSFDGTTLRLSLIRASYDPDPLPEVGRHEFRLALVPFAGRLSAAAAIRQGMAFNHPLRTMGTGIHAGSLPPQATGLCVGPEPVVLLALKKAEDAEALLLRLVETAGKAATASVRIPATLGQPVRATETDLMERPLPKSTAKLRGDVVTVTIPPHGIASLRIDLARPSHGKGWHQDKHNIEAKP